MTIIGVRLEPAGVELSLAAGERLLDALDETQQTRCALPSACRAGNCGTCRVEVLAGNALLAPADGQEVAVLRELGAGAAERLGCQVYASRGAAGVLVLRVIGA